MRIGRWGALLRVDSFARRKLQDDGWGEVVQASVVKVSFEGQRIVRYPAKFCYYELYRNHVAVYILQLNIGYRRSI